MLYRSRFEVINYVERVKGADVLGLLGRGKHV